MLSVWIVTHIDAANFLTQLGETRAFSTEAAAIEYGAARRTRYRDQRIAEGETDYAFINAIDYEYVKVDLDNSEI
jgi:hypothetical protein